MKKMILGIVWQLMGFLGSIIILCSAAPYQWDYNGITGILGSLLGLDLIIPLIICIIFFICGAVVCFKAISEMRRSLRITERQPTAPTIGIA